MTLEPAFKPMSAPRCELNSSRSTPTSSPTSLSQRISKVWQHFKDSDLIKNCAIRNPFKAIFASGNNYVETMWSDDYFIGCKKNLEIAKGSIKEAFSCIKDGEVKKGAKNLLSAVAALTVLGLNVELGNFLKGALGVLISTGKLVIHGVEFTARTLLCLIMVIIAGPALFCNETLRKHFLDNCNELKNSLQNIFKDLASIITCTGHAIPSWLPLVIMAACPPAGIALLIIKNAAKFTGIFDLLGYGGTAILLKMQQLTASEENKKEVDKKWNELKEALNPFKSYEGAAIGAFGVHVATTAVATLGNFALSHFGINVSSDTLSKGVDAVTAIAFGVFGYKAYQSSKQVKKEPLSAEEWAHDILNNKGHEVA